MAKITVLAVYKKFNNYFVSPVKGKFHSVLVAIILILAIFSSHHSAFSANTGGNDSTNVVYKCFGVVTEAGWRVFGPVITIIENDKPVLMTSTSSKAEYQIFLKTNTWYKFKVSREGHDDF